MTKARASKQAKADKPDDAKEIQERIEAMYAKADKRFRLCLNVDQNTLDAIADIVLAHRPKPKSKPARRRKRRANKMAANKKGD